MTIQTELFVETKPLIAPESLCAYDWIIVNSSAGKDSLAMLSLVCELAAAQNILDRVVVVHADLGRVEWEGTVGLAEAQAAHFGVHFLRVWRRQGDLLQQIEARGMFPANKQRFCTAHHKQNPAQRALVALGNETRAQRATCHGQPRDGDLLEQIERRGKFPDNRNRYCTSDQKRAQIQRVFTALATGTRNETPGEQKPVRILNCLGMRSDESPARAKKQPFIETDPVNSNGRRQVDTWLPLHAWTEARV